MRQTPNYDLNLFDATDKMEVDSRLAFNENFETLDTALGDTSEKTDEMYDSFSPAITKLNMYGGQTVVDAGELKSAQANKITIGAVEKSVPADVIALDGYGHSAGLVYNSIEWVGGKAYFHKRVASVDLGSLTWDYTSGVRTFFFANLPDNTPLYTSDGTQNVVCPNYATITGRQLYYNSVDKGICASTAMISGATNRVYVYDTAYTDAATFKTAMDGVPFYYELAEEVVTEITNLFPSSFNLFVATGGTSFEFVDSSIAWEIPYDTENATKIFADQILYDADISGLSTNNVQGAIDEISQPATPITAGLMSASDKAKLDNNTIFPTDTNEYIVGTWVDGKPIYRKRFTGTTAATGNTTVIDNTNTYDRGIAVYGDINGGLVNAYLNATFFTGIWINTSTHMPVLYYPDTANWHSKPYDIVMEYTKTTD